MQSTSHLMMIRPVDFKFNTQTAGDNKFQKKDESTKVQEEAQLEFDNFVEQLKSNGIDVTVIEDTLTPETPDSIFPNNWISFHEDGSVFLYPMHSPNRRLERRKDILEILKQKFQINHITDLSFFELQHAFLEGTGSMVLDRKLKIVYACISERTDAEVLHNFCMLSGYKAVSFHANDQQGFPIYHTNVMMCVAQKYVVICSNSITDIHERQYVLNKIKSTGKEIIEIDEHQMNQFAGNMLELTKDNNSLIVMSEQAYKSLSSTQIKTLEKYSKIVHSPLYTIEKNGGGSARCMLAEIYLPLK